MTRVNWLIAALALGGATGVDAVPTGGDSIEGGLLKAAISSGLIGLMLLWFVFQSRKDRDLERTEAAARERQLAERLNKIEDEIRGSLAGKLVEVGNTLDDFVEVARHCRQRAGMSDQTGDSRERIER